MFDFSFSEIALLVIVAMIFIRPKDMPIAIRTVSNGLKAMRRMAAEFQFHVDEMVREADLAETRNELRDLRNLNLRDRVKRFVDEDGALEHHLSLDKPGDAFGVNPRLPHGPPPSSARLPSIEAGGFSNALPGNGAAEAPEPGVNHDVAEAPAILPPGTARCLLAERRRWQDVPPVVPPVYVVHHGHRVPVIRKDAGARTQAYE